MNIKETIEFLENLKNNSEKKSEINLYKLFWDILISIEWLKLSEEKIKNISSKLEELNIDSIQEKQYKYIKKQYIAFTQYLENEHKLIEKWRYLSLWMTFWMMFWLAIATATWFEFWMWNETTGWLIWWMLFGMVIWSFMDKKAEDENRVLKK
jgi:hypothetical protein